METAVQQVCSNCGNPLLPDGKFCLFCGDVLDEASQAKHPFDSQSAQVLAIVPSPPPMEYAGFWRRVWAGTLDIAIEAVAALLITAIVDLVFKIASPEFGLSPITARYFTGIVFIFVLTIGGWLYSAFCESGPWRATIGKRTIGLEVVTSAGDKLTFGQATVRHFMKFLSLFTASIGFMMAGWTKRRQALHDIPSDCVVVRVAEPSLSLFGIAK